MGGKWASLFNLEYRNIRRSSSAFQLGKKRKVNVRKYQKMILIGKLASLSPSNFLINTFRHPRILREGWSDLTWEERYVLSICSICMPLGMRRHLSFA